MRTGVVLQNRYEVADKLGEGGFGTVHKAFDRRLKRWVAVKQITLGTPDDQAFLWSIDREVELLANLEHPVLPDVSDYFNEGHDYYIVMDYIPGMDLSQIVEQRGRLSLPEALSIVTPVLSALEYLHSRTPPVIHRDIKPGNIRVTDDERVYLVDFGLAKQYDPDTVNPHTRISLSHNFAPIEQYQRGGADLRADLYALGATMYTMLSGTAPPGAPERVVRDQLQPLSSLNPVVPPRLNDIVMRLLEMRAEDRYQSAADLRRDLERFEEEYMAAVRPGATVPLQPGQTSLPSAPGTRRRIGCWVLPIIPVVILALIGVLIGPSNLRAWFAGLSFQGESATAVPPPQPTDPPTEVLPSPTPVPPATPTLEPTLEPTPTELACQVPDLIGLDQFEAEEQLRQADLQPQISFETDDSNLPFGSVVRQSPRAGQPCAPGDTVQIVIKARSAN